MAAGILHQTVTTTTGETIEMAFYVDDTVSPTTWKPVSMLVNGSGTELDFGATGPVSMESNTIYAGSTALTPISDPVACSSSGDNAIVASLGTGKKIRVLAWDLSPSAAVNAKWRSASTDITGLYYMGSAGNGQARGFNPIGWFETAVNEALQLNLSGAVPVGGVVVYVQV